MTGIAWRAESGPRSLRHRRARRLVAVAITTVLTGILCTIFILPLIYMVSASFQTPSQQSQENAPLYPAIIRTYGYQGKTLQVYNVPNWKGPGTGTHQLALLDDVIFIGSPTKFVDPDNGQVVEWQGLPSQTSLAWQFNLDTSNFPSAWKQIAPDICLSGNDWCGYPVLFRNTLLIAIVGTIGAVGSAILVGYGFARFRFPFRNTLFIVLIGTILLPFQVTLIPQYVIFQSVFGWIGTPLPLIVPHFFSNAYNVFLLRQYFMTLPRELDEAAMIDGAGPLRTLISVIIPQSWPAIIAVALFHFFFAWNDFLGPLVYLSDTRSWWPIAIGLNMFNSTFRNAGTPSVIQAGALISLVLPVVIFFLAQRVFMRGVVVSGVEK